MRPDTLSPDMNSCLDWYGLDTLAELVKAVDVARLAPEMRKTAAAVVEHLPFAARQLAAVLSQPASWPLCSRSPAGRLPLGVRMQQVSCLTVFRSAPLTCALPGGCQIALKPHLHHLAKA